MLNITAIPFYTSLHIFQELMRSFQRDIVWPCSLKDFKVTSVQSWMFALNACFDAIYIVNRAPIFTGQTLKAGSSAIFWSTRSYNTFLEWFHQFLKDLKMYKGIPIHLDTLRQPGSKSFHSINRDRSVLFWTHLYLDI